jgi:hypothetical protein
LLLAAAPAPAEANELFAPEQLPDGWYVLQARPPDPADTPAQTSTYYEGDGDRALAAISFGLSEYGFENRLEGKERPVQGIPNGDHARIIRNDPWVWVFWPAQDVEDTMNLVAARGLSDNEAIAAARAARIPARGAVRIAARGLPSDLHRAAVAWVHPDTGPSGAEQITLVSSSGRARIEIKVSTAGRAVRAFHRFWVDQFPRRDFRPPRRAVLREDGRQVVFVSGAARRSILQQLAGGTDRVDLDEWNAFRERVADVPVAALFPGGSGDGVTLDGSVDGIRWGVRFETTQTALDVSDVVINADGTSGGGSGGPLSDLPAGIVSIGTSTTSGGNGPEGTTAAGVAPAGTKIVRFEPPGKPPIEAVVAATGPDPTHVYFATFLPNLGGDLPVIALDANGNELARRENFGCNVCP